MNEGRAFRMRRPSFVVIAVALCVAAGATIAIAQGFDLPGFVSAKEEIPAQEPDAGQQVVVLEIQIRRDDDSLAAELISQRVVDSFAPKDVARSAGDWEVRISGDRDLAYLIPNPLADIEVENPQDERAPFAGVQLTSFDWTLVVPLYHDGKPLGAQTIQITDLTTGDTILRVPVQSEEG